MQYLKAVIVLLSVFLTTKATFFKKYESYISPPVTHTQVFQSEPQVLPLAHSLEPAPVYENTGEVINPALLPPPSLYAIQPVTHYVSLPPSYPFIPYPLLNGVSFAQSSASASAGNPYLVHNALYNADQSQRYAAASQEIQNQQLIEAARQQAAYNTAVQQASASANQQPNTIVQSNVQSDAVSQNEPLAPINQYGVPNQQIQNIASSQSESNTDFKNHLFTPTSQYVAPQGQILNTQSNGAANNLDQSQYIPITQYGTPQELALNAGSHVQNNAALQNHQTIASINQYSAPQQQIINSASQAHSNAASSSAASSNIQNQQLATPFSSTSTRSASSAATASAHSSSHIVSNTPGLATASSTSQSFATSSASSSFTSTAPAAPTPYIIPGSTSTSNTASSASSSADSSSSVVNVADNFIVPSASYGPPQ